MKIRYILFFCLFLQANANDATEINKEITILKRINKLYEEKIQTTNILKRNNVISLLKLTAKETLVIEEIITVDKKIKKIYEMADEDK